MPLPNAMSPARVRGDGRANQPSAAPMKTELAAINPQSKASVAIGSSSIWRSEKRSAIPGAPEGAPINAIAAEIRTLSVAQSRRTGARQAGRHDRAPLHRHAVGGAGLKWLCDPESGVSAHYFVFEDGRIAQLVHEDRRAWHAGKSFWAGETDINSRSIGIEIANPGHEFGYVPFPEAQVAAVIDLCRHILSRHAIAPERTLAHSDTAPLRKEDPGELFPWDRLHAAGIGHWVPAEPIVDGPVLQVGNRGPGVADLKARLAAYGYGIAAGPAFDTDTAAVVIAFQRHFRQARVDGVADVSALATLDRLLAALG
jgi:N-acetylmuramoyl-L-alanine amidase